VAGSKTPTGATEDGARTIDEVMTRAELGVLLTDLRRRSAYSLRDLAAEIGSSPSTLSGWCRAENLPFAAQHEVFRDLLRVLGVADTEPWVDALIRVRDGGGTRADPSTPPYRGLESFGRGDADRFFGREELVQQTHARWCSLLHDDERPNLLALVGPSGSGKSSLLHAGLLPVLEGHGTTCWTMTPGVDPAGRLARLLGDARRQGGDGGDQVVLIDQFEELFTTCRDHGEREAFLDLLDEVAASTGSVVRGVVIALRIDFYADLVGAGRLVRSLQHTQVLVGPMCRDELMRAIVGPAEQVGATVDDDLVALLLRDFVPSGALGARHDAGALPLLSHALLQTWRRSRRGHLTVGDYHAAGGIDGAIERSAELVYGELSPDEQALVRQLFLRLVHLEGDTIATRRAATYDELAGLVPHDDPPRDRDGDEVAPRHGTGTVSSFLDRFVDARLLTAHGETVEITHEALLAAWPRLRSWIEEDREALRLHRRLAEAARSWADSDRDPSVLARGARLEELRAWLEAGSGRLVPNRLERDFLEASVRQAEAETEAARRRTRRLRVLVAITTVFGLIAGASAVAAVQARSDALLARDEALSRQVALTAARLAEVDPSVAAQLAVVGYRIAPTSEARSALLDAAATPRAARILGGAGSTALAMSDDGALVAVSDAVRSHVQLLARTADGAGRIATIPLADADAESFALAFSPDGQVLAVGDTTTAITLWDVADPSAPAPLGEPLHGPEGPIQGLAFHPGGHELAAVGLGDGVFRWDLQDPVAPVPLPLLPSEHITWAVAYHPAGDRLVVGEDAGAAVLWELGSEPRPLVALEVGDRSTLSVAVAPDGTAVAAGSRDGEVAVWDVTDPAAPTPVELDDATFASWVNALEFGPDGATLAAGSSDGSLRVYSTTTWGSIQDLPHPAALTDVTFTDGGATLASVATDGTTRFWDTTDRPIALGGSIWSLGFSADGERLAAFSAVDTGVWDVSPDGDLEFAFGPIPEPADELGFTGGGAMSPDGLRLAHGTQGGDVLLHDLAGGTPDEGRPLGATPGLVEMTAFSADGRLLAAGGGDTDVRVWTLDGDTPTLVATLDDPAENVLNLAFSAVGRLLAVPSADGHVYLYDLEDPDAPALSARLDGFDSEVYGVAFTPDGHVLAAAGTDAYVLLWDVSDPAAPRRIGEPLGGPTGRVFDLAFDASGARLAAGVVDGSTWVWDTTDLGSAGRFAVLGPSSGPIYAVRFGPSGGDLVAGGARAEVHRWRIDEEAAVDAVCGRAGDPLTTDEWELHLPGRPYDPPCGARS
jgi:WD40 repeat protein/transcriptional regulator with XRE-family HTH domain